jgi:hypothetical protein
VLKPLDFLAVGKGGRTLLFLKAVMQDLLARPGLLKRVEDVSAVFGKCVTSHADLSTPPDAREMCSPYRLGNSSDRTVLRDSIEVFMLHHISAAGLAASTMAGSPAAFSPTELHSRIKAAKRALASVTAGAEEDVFG